jgi:hypothetical protein
MGARGGAQQTPAAAGALLEVSHLPPLLTLAGEQVDLTYDVHCAPGGAEDSGHACDVRGTVFFRTERSAPFRPLALAPDTTAGVRQLATPVPAAVSEAGFEYYAVIESAPGDERLVVPSGGADAPHRSLPLREPTEAQLGTHVFGSTTRGARVASARWGDGPLETGLEPGRGLPPIGASAFDVGRDGSVLLLDQAHRRLLRWEPGDARPAAVPVSINGRLADMTVDGDGSIFILESVAPPGRAPFVRRFDDSGRELDVTESAERTPSQIRLGPNGPVVLGGQSHQWMPVTADGAPASPPDQRARGRTGRPLQTGGEVVVLRRDREILVALIAKGRVQHSWRVTSRTPLAEVQLADPLGRGLVVVARVFDDGHDEFVALVLDRQGLGRSVTMTSSDWAESAPLGRFRLVGTALYRLGSTSAGAFVDRFDLEVR